MVQIHRRSPILFKGKPVQRSMRDAWEVILVFEGETEAPKIIDLSHRSKWDVQDSNLSQIKPWGIKIPEHPGECILENGLLINRMNRTQAACWHLEGDTPSPPGGNFFTETTDGFMLIALIGDRIFSIMEKVCAIDLHSPKNRPPCLFQAPLCHVPAQMVFLGKKAGSSSLLLACARGYGQNMAEALLDAGEEWGLHPAGERAFIDWLSKE